MSAPNPRKELATRADLKVLATKSELKTAVAPLATKAELAAAVARLATKDELAAAIAPLATKDELHAAIADAVAPLATKDELHAAIADAVAPLATKAELYDVRSELKVEIQQIQVALEEHRGQVREEMVTKARFEDVTRALMVGIEDVRTQLTSRIDSLPTHDDLARHVNTIITTIGTAITAVDQKYADLPARVSRLEDASSPKSR